MSVMRGALTAIGARREPTASEKLIAFLIRWGILSAAVWVAAAIIDGIHLGGWESTLLVGLILGLLNALLRPILFWITLPLTVLTLGFFLLILNTGIFALTAWIAGKFDGINFAIDGFWAAFFGALIVSVVGWFLGFLFDADRVARDATR